MVSFFRILSWVGCASRVGLGPPQIYSINMLMGSPIDISGSSIVGNWESCAGVRNHHS